jgi:hypothetical protein
MFAERLVTYKLFTEKICCLDGIGWKCGHMMYRTCSECNEMGPALLCVYWLTVIMRAWQWFMYMDIHMHTGRAVLKVWMGPYVCGTGSTRVKRHANIFGFSLIHKSPSVDRRHTINKKSTMNFITNCIWKHDEFTRNTPEIFHHDQNDLTKHQTSFLGTAAKVREAKRN